MSRVVEWMDRRFYPGQRSHWDDALFRRRVLDVLEPGMRVLDLGAGAGILPEMNFRDSGAYVCGVDPDPRVLENPYLHEARVGRGEAIPWDDETFDVVFCDNVFEHLEDPVAVFREVRRVLRPGGMFLAKTPNRRHYMATVARSSPHAFHVWYNRRRGRRSPEDIFPTVYRANTPEDIERHAHAAGLRLDGIELVEGRPEYLRIHPIPYAFGLVWERIVNASERLARFRIVIVARLLRT